MTPTQAVVLSVAGFAGFVGFVVLRGPSQPPAEPYDALSRESAEVAKSRAEAVKLIDKPIGQIVDEARQRDDVKAKSDLVWQEEKRRNASRIAAIDSCHNLLREKMEYLDPTNQDDYTRGADGRGVVVSMVKLHDTFSAAPVGIVKCDIDVNGEAKYIQKVER